MNQDFDFVVFWANEFKRNPKKNRLVLIKFINSQIKISQKSLEKLEPAKLIKIFNIKNEKLIQKLYDN